MKPYVKRFLESVFPGMVELAQCSFNEEGMLNAASDTIDELRTQVAAAKAWLEADDASIQPRMHEDHLMHLAREAFRNSLEEK